MYLGWRLGGLKIVRHAAGEAGQVAFEWTVKVYLGLMVTALFGLLSLLVLAVLIPKVRAVFALFSDK